MTQRIPVWRKDQKLKLLSDLDKPRLKLSGEDGNAFSIIGRARRAAKKAGWTEEKITAFQDDAMSGDYNHVLQTCMKYFEVE